MKQDKSTKGFTHTFAYLTLISPPPPPTQFCLGRGEGAELCINLRGCHFMVHSPLCPGSMQAPAWRDAKGPQQRL